jgi:6-phosphogluconolactonase
MIEPAIEVAASRAALVETCAELIAGALNAGIAARGRASFVASGGSTPRDCYRLLARKTVDWARVILTLSDERWVDVRSEDSNERMLRETLMSGRAAAARLVSLKARRGGFEAGAGAAEKKVKDLAPFDVTLLGMGEDGHIASLFPGHPALAEGLDPRSPRWCVGVAPAAPAPDLPRVSLTLSALLQSRLIVLLITGEAKRSVVIAPGDRPVTALLTQASTPVRIMWAA